MEDEDQFTVPLDNTVVLDSPILETHLHTPDINTEALDVPDSIRDVSEQTDDKVDDSVKDIVFDSDEEGHEFMGIFSRKESKTRDAGHASNLEKRKLTAPGYIQGFARKVCGHSLRSLSSARSIITDEHYNAGHPGTKSIHETNYLGPSVILDCGISKLKEEMLHQSNINNADKDQKRLQCTKKRTRKNLGGDALVNEKSASNNCETMDGVRDAPFVPCHHKLASGGETDTQEPGEHSQENALDFVDHFLSVNSLEISGNTDYGRANQINSPPTSRAKGAQILAWRANLGYRARESGILDWAEKQPAESNFGGELDDQSDVESLGKSLEKDDTGTNTPEIFDVGFNTQMAAEAMEALLYASPPNYNVRFTHQIPEIVILSSKGEPESMKSKSCAHQHLACSNSQITGRESENVRESNSVSPIENNVTSREPLTGKSVTCSHPVRVKKNINAWYSRRIHRQKQDGTLERHNLKEACPDLSSSKSVECEKYDMRKSFQLTKRSKCQSSVKSLEISKDSIHSFKRRKCSRVEFDVTETKQKKKKIDIQVHKMLGVRGKHIQLHSDASAEITNGKRTWQEKVTSILIGDSIQLKLDPWNHPKGKRTHRSARRHTDGSINSSALLTVADDEKESEYPIVNSKTIKRKRGPLEYIQDEFPSSMERRPSVGLPKLETDEKKSPGFYNCESGITGEKMAATELDRGESSKQSGKVEKGPISSVAYSNNTKLDAVSDDTKLSEKCQTNEKRKKLGRTIFSKPSVIKELTRLGYNRSLPDFLPRESRRRKSGNVCILFSQHLDSTIINQQKKIVARLGFSVASCCSDATHFITDRFVRTKNMLEAIAFGKPVVTHLWLERCRQANCCIDEKNYILRDVKKEKEIGFSMPVSLACAGQYPLLKDRKVLVTPNIKPGKELIQSLVKAVQGKAVQRIQRAEQKDEIIPNDVLILSSVEDYTTCVPFLEKGAAVYDPELLLNGIVIQKLEYERHRLFTSYVGGNGSSKCRRERRGMSHKTSM